MRVIFNQQSSCAGMSLTDQSTQKTEQLVIIIDALKTTPSCKYVNTSFSCFMGILGFLPLNTKDCDKDCFFFFCISCRFWQK